MQRSLLILICPDLLRFLIFLRIFPLTTLSAKSHKSALIAFDVRVFQISTSVVTMTKPRDDTSRPCFPKPSQLPNGAKSASRSSGLRMRHCAPDTPGLVNLLKAGHQLGTFPRRVGVERRVAVCAVLWRGQRERAFNQTRSVHSDKARLTIPKSPGTLLDVLHGISRQISETIQQCSNTGVNCFQTTIACERMISNMVHVCLCRCA